VLACVALAAVLVVALMGGARADFMTGNQLWEKCQASPPIICAGYVSAVADIMGHHTVFNRRACFAPEVTNGQVADVVKKWLREHPESRHYVASSLAAEALAEAFPCKP
jgi:hypothetical protein